MLRILITIIASVILTFGKAQLCSGSLGDPVVNITFGSGGNSNTGYVPPTGAYTYINSSCPNDGYYTITNQTSGCFNNSWLTINSDHTGNGAFMLVNASYAPGDFFLTTVDNLCPNTTYEFASWIMNVIAFSGIKPNITFKIETPGGIVLQQYSTGDIPQNSSPVWKQYGFYFTTPSNNASIVLRMTNNAPGGVGNDLALDDITFRPCGAGIISAAIQNNIDTVHVCKGNTDVYNLRANVSSAYQSPVYVWQVSIDSGKNWQDIIGATSLTYVRLASGIGAYWYRLSVTDKNSTSCRISSNVIAINVHDEPVVNAGADRIMFAGDSITIDATVTGEKPLYNWDPPNNLNDINLLNPTASPLQDKIYTLYATSAYGCKAQDDMFIKVVKDIFVPTAFTPNNDGKNDHWRIPFLDPILNADVRLYNRFGQLIYHVKGQTVNWDGNFKGLPQPTGTYVYSIKFTNGQHADLKGTVLLIR